MSPASNTIRYLYALSQALGWLYTVLWSASFYPQPLLNWRRRSTDGAAIDFPFLNSIGFLCYTTSTWAFLYSPTVRFQYAERHPHAPEPTTRFNDFAFGMHAVILCFVVYSQYYQCIWGFKNKAIQHVSRPASIIATVCAFLVLTSVIQMVTCNGLWDQVVTTWAWIDVVYALGNVKLIITFIKYIPQVALNYQRKSTVGWSIMTMIFDITGGFMSLAQLLIDAGLENDWSGVTGNPVKFGLSLITIGYDTILIFQHILYRHPRDWRDGNGTEGFDDKAVKKDEFTPLLSSA